MIGGNQGFWRIESMLPIWLASTV